MNVLSTTQAVGGSMTDEQIEDLWLRVTGFNADDERADIAGFARALLAASEASAKLVNYEELEREYFGDAESGTGIYAPRPAIEASIADTAGAIPEGWKLVPTAPTAEMIVAIENQIDSQLTASGMDPRHMFRQDGEYVYEAMLAATPAPSVADARDICGSCSGSGFADATGLHNCFKCNGSGADYAALHLTPEQAAKEAK